MIALARNPRCRKSADHAKYLTMLPAIAHYASAAFRHLDAEAREDAITEVVANTFVAYAHLAELGKTGIAYPTVLALFGIRRYWDGRRVGTKANCRDVYRSGLRRQHLGTSRDQRWQEAVIDNTKSPVPDQAAFRIDFPHWLQSLTPRDRDVALRLCRGDRPSEVARQYRISRGRVSQLRRELHDDWLAFHGEDETAENVADVVDHPAASTGKSTSIARGCATTN